MANPQDPSGGGVGEPGIRWFLISPNNSENLAVKPRGIYVGTAGNVVFVGDDGVAVTFTCTAGSYHPLRPIRVNSTGTTSSQIIGIY